MLIDVLKMPPVFGMPIERAVHLDGGIGSMVDAISHITSMTLGNQVTEKLRNLYKAIYLSQDERYIFEVVFTGDSPERCLYVKMIYPTGTIVGISVKTLQHYNATGVPMVPISEIILSPSPSTIPYSGQYMVSSLSGVHSIAPPVYDTSMVWDYVLRVLDIKKRGPLEEHNILSVFQPVYEHVPGVMDALLSGTFFRSPLLEMQRPHPSFYITPEKWFLYNEVAYRTQIMQTDTRVNQPEFDPLVLRAVLMPQTKFSYTTLISYAIDGIRDVGDPREYRDPYQFMLNGPTLDLSLYHAILADLLFKATMAYCRIKEIDSMSYLENAKDRSTITITRNIYDEVCFTFHDHLRGEITCFYSAFPALALVTQSVGYYQRPY
jgi:hypothetical protein